MRAKLACCTRELFSLCTLRAMRSKAHEQAKQRHPWLDRNASKSKKQSTNSRLGQPTKSWAGPIPGGLAVSGTRARPISAGAQLLNLQPDAAVSKTKFTKALKSPRNGKRLPRQKSRKNVQVKWSKSKAAAKYVRSPRSGALSVRSHDVHAYGEAHSACV